MQRALDSAIGLPSRPTSALWMLVLVMPAEVRRNLMGACSFARGVGVVLPSERLSRAAQIIVRRSRRGTFPSAGAGEILQPPGYAPGVAHYLFNFVKGDAAKGLALREQAARFLRLRMWGIGAGERHGNALVPGDLVLIYLGAPERKFVGRAELASPTHDWTPSEAQVYPGDCRS